MLVLVAVLAITTSGLAASSSNKRPARKRTGSGSAAKAAHAKSSHARSASVSSRGRTKHSVRRAGKTGVRKSARARGQQGIEGERAREIQQALIRAKYLEGEPTGVWDQRSREAMTRFQQDNGWQTKVIPDSRALIKLGLGPKHANLVSPPPSFRLSGGDAEAGRGDMHAGGGAPQ